MTDDPTPAVAEARATKATEPTPLDTAFKAYWAKNAAMNSPWHDFSAGFNAALSLPPPEAQDDAAPSPETGWPPRPQPIADRRDETDVVQPAAPAAPSPDLAALEELVKRLESVTEHGFVPGLGLTRALAYASTIRSAILHLKAQPNAGPSADGGEGGR